MEPIPGGYPIDDRISNSAQVRLNESGITFLEENIDSILTSFLPDGLDFEVSSDDICSSGGCFLHGEIEEFTLQPEAPNRLIGHVRLNLTTRNAAGERDELKDACFDVPLAGRTCCDVDVDTGRGSRSYVGLIANIDFVAETQPARNGYTKVVVTPGGSDGYFAGGEGIEDDDFDLSGGILCSIGNLGFVKGFIVDEINSQFGDQIQSAIDDQLCTTRGEYGCPTGTFAVPDEMPDSVCRYADAADAECVPTLLGTDGQGDLGAAFLGGFSPGTHAPGQFVLAAGGDGEAVANGMTINMYGGFRGTDRSFTESPAHNPCVPLVEPPPLPTVPEAMFLRENTIPGGGESHISLGLSEQYLNYTGYGLFDSGMLCLGAGTRLSQQISTGLFSILIMSLKDLAFPDSAAPISLAIRPQEPPVFEIGEGTEADALLNVTLPAVQIDFYVWSSERYVRFLTYQADLTIPINLVVEDGAIAPQISDVIAEESSVTNSELLQEDPTELAALIQDVISMFAGMLTGSIDPIELPDIMGFNLLVPENGIQGIEDSGDEFLAIFANLEVATGSGAFTATSDTWARIESVHVDPEVLKLETYGDGEIPWARVEVEGDGPSGAEFEYSWRLDGMAWSEWTQDNFLIVQDRALLLQARHELEVRSRIVGVPGSHDHSPERLELLIDGLAPDVTAAREDGGVRITATDVLTASDDLQYRIRRNDGEWDAWQALGDEAFVALAYDDASVDVEVKDEAGNVGAARSALIRGLPNPDGGGCECGVVGEGGGGMLWGLGLLGVFGLLMRRRGAGRGQRRRSKAVKRSKQGKSGVGRLSLWLLVLFAVPTALGAQGCDCGGDDDPGTPAGPCDDMCPVMAEGTGTTGNICCEATDMCVPYDRDALCDPGFECPAANITLDESCGLSCSECMRKPALEPGLLATYLDMEVTGDGSIVFSGYSPGVPPTRQYGDLVVGMYDAGSMSTTWEIVDGAPTSPITNDPDGYRGGVSAPGDDVGRWTQIEEAGGNYYVAYYDQTNTALKMAIGTPGGSWAVHTVDEQADSGSYASMLVDDAGIPHVAYLRVSAADDGTGVVNGSVLVASAASANPAAPTDWTVTEVSTAPMPCRPQYCADGTTCLENDGLCVTATSDCAEECADDQACYMAACEAALPDNYVEDIPPAYGLFPSLAQTSTGMALVWYDRTAGNLMGAAFDGAAWGAAFLIDGYGVGDPDVGDSGMWASLHVDAADAWHVAYVDGAEEAVRYALVEGGAVTSTELVDDGSTDGTMRHTDGRHIVGDDTSIVVTDGGQIRIAYQDATAQRVVLATRGSGDTEWAISILDADDKTGWWVVQELVGTTSYVGTWWRNQQEGTNGVRVLTVE